MTLTGHFLVNPFTPVKGSYNGLALGATAEGTGFFAVRLANNGSFTGSLRVGSLRIPLKGKFSNSGRYTRVLKFGSVAYNIDLTLNVSGTGAQQISGTVTGGNVNVTINSDRAVFNRVTNPAPQAGIYNVIIPPDPVQDGLYPLGTGYGRVSVSSSGVTRFSGRLASGPAFNAGAQLSATGQWPFFAGLYGRKGGISGVISFDLNDPAHDITGPLVWTKPSGVLSVPAYPEGFTGRSSLIGSKFQQPAAGERLFLESTGGAGNFLVTAEANADLSEIQEVLAANLSTTQTLTVDLPEGATIENVITSVNPLTGLFSGTFKEGTALRGFRGAIVGPKLNRAAGFFGRGTRTGSIEIIPAP
jgi:hypothetical protein